MLRLPCLAAVAGLLLVTSPCSTAESIRSASMPVSLVILGTCSVSQSPRAQPQVDCLHGDPVRITRDAPDGAWHIFF
ncbi:hypothetical protein BRI6_3463 [plant metagenome]|uniref:Uncharacterized protein n=1 Tax=plant metagenome TaxID=1297885 RepID=A0A484VFY8_9ZZZZ